MTICWAKPRSVIPAAWYWPQPQIENGESRARRLAAGHEVAGDRAGREQADDDLLGEAEVRDSRRVVLAPAPDRERRVPISASCGGARSSRRPRRPRASR